MPFLILLLFVLALLLYLTIRLKHRKELRRYLIFLVIADVWVVLVLSYFLFSAVFD